MLTRRHGFLLLGILFCTAASPATATNLVYTWTGTLTFVDAALVAENPPFAVTDPFSLTFVVDSSTVGTPGGPTGQLSYTPLVSIALTLNSSYTIDGRDFSSSIGITHDPGNSSKFLATGSGLSGAPDLGVWRPSIYQALLDDPSGMALASNALPTTLDINDWPLTSLTVVFFDTTSTAPNVLVRGDITGVSVVPEPATMFLLLGGLVGLAALRRRLA